MHLYCFESGIGLLCNHYITTTDALPCVAEPPSPALRVPFTGGPANAFRVAEQTAMTNHPEGTCTLESLPIAATFQQECTRTDGLLLAQSPSLGCTG
jgi:hypothetical protein